MNSTKSSAECTNGVKNFKWTFELGNEVRHFTAKVSRKARRKCTYQKMFLYILRYI